MASWHGPVQMVFDLILVTCLIYLTGTQDSYFIWLYPLAIIVASILFSRKATFIVAGFSFILIGGLAELVYYNILPRMQVAVPSSRQLQTWILSNLFYFMAVAYLSSLLAQSLRRHGAELRSQARGIAGPSGIQSRTLFTPCAGVCSPRIWTAGSSC